MRARLIPLLFVAASALACRSHDRAHEPLAIKEVDPDQLRRDLATEQAIRALTERSLAAYERASVALETTGRDCDAAADALHRILAEDGQAIARAKALSDVPELLERARPVLQEQAERTRRLTGRFAAASSRCAANPRVARLLGYF